MFSAFVEHAIELAAQWHDRTYRKSRWRAHPFDLPDGELLRVPVMAHLTAVATTVQRAGWDDVTVAAAFLHDILEDANLHGDHVPADWLREQVGREATALVEAVSEQKRDDEGNWLPWQARKEGYLAGLAASNARAVAISLADKLHNVWTMNQALERGVDIFTSTPDRRGLSAGPDRQQWYFRAVLDLSRRFTDPRLDPLRRRLEREVERFEELVGLG